MKIRYGILMALFISILCFSGTAFAASVAPDVNLGMGSVSHVGNISRPGTFYPELYFKKGEGYVHPVFKYNLSSFPTNFTDAVLTVTATNVGSLGFGDMTIELYADNHYTLTRKYLGTSIDYVGDFCTFNVTNSINEAISKNFSSFYVEITHQSYGESGDNEHVQIEVNLTVTGSQPPSNLSASKDTTSLNLYWSANGNNPGTVYEVYMGSTLLGTTESTSYRVTGLSPGTYYSFKVRATYTDNPPSNYASAGFYTLPAAPAVSVDCGGLDWSQVAGRGYVKLSWPAVTGANGYYVYIHDGNTYQKFSVGSATSWDSRVQKIYPDEGYLDGFDNNTQSANLFNTIKGGLDLRDDPNKLYLKTVGASYDNVHNTYYFRVSAYNASGEGPISSFAAVLPNRTDNTPPTGSIVINDGDMKTGTQNVKVKVSASDNASGVDAISLSKDGVTWDAWMSYSPGNVYDYQIEGGSGPRYVYLRVRDKAGNISSTVKDDITLKDDNQGPVVTLSINNGAELTTDTSVVLTISTYDDLTPIDDLKMRFSNDGRSWSAWESVSFVKDWTLSAGEGLKNVFIQVKDASGNTTTSGDTISYYANPLDFGGINKETEVDKEPPLIKSVEISNGASIISSNSIPLSIVADDNMGTDGLKMSFSADGSTWTAPLAYKAKYTVTGFSFSTGYNIIYVKVIDAYGNFASDRVSFFKK